MPSLDFRLASAVKVPLHDEDKEGMGSRKKKRKVEKRVTEVTAGLDIGLKERLRFSQVLYFGK